jgi:hypothetical protein
MTELSQAHDRSFEMALLLTGVAYSELQPQMKAV